MLKEKLSIIESAKVRYNGGSCSETSKSIQI
nr:MAG TPA: hypothetical protein [Caudoviricetes sp.]DAP06748.1 MAG TPA: hypothetical protein [Caudoviricetes sp.]